jgi:hypothetical protein
MRNIGVGLIVAVYAVLLFTSSSAPVFMRDTGFVNIQAHAHFDPMMVVVTIAGVAGCDSGSARRKVGAIDDHCNVDHGTVYALHHKRATPGRS